MEPPMGGRKSLMSMRVRSSGYIMFVSLNSACRNTCSEQPKRSAMPGRNHTGSMAAFVTRDWPSSFNTTPSGFRLPLRSDSFVSGKSMCALVTAIVGRIS